MSVKKKSKVHLCLLFSLIWAAFAFSSPVFAIPETENPAESSEITSESTETPSETSESEAESDSETAASCTDQVGAVGWLVCPGTGFIAKTTDALYSIIQDLLIVKPLVSDTSSPTYTVWDYCRGITNIIFIIFILIVIYSQLTGVGISNYGIKRTLPRIIIAAILVNLSFLICSLSIEISNIIGTSFRGFFENIQNSLTADTIALTSITWEDLVSALTGGAIAGTIAIGATGGIAAAFLALIPVLIGALVAVISGLLTIAGRQAIVALLAMVSPLAFVAYLLPNTESWFEKWKKLLIRMIVFYPLFSLLFGASQLAGWAIISSATNAYGIILGMAVQIYPLLASWSLMKMSGTVLERINTGVHKIASPLQRSATNWAAESRNIARAKYVNKQLMGATSVGGFLAARAAQDRANRAESQRLADENSKMLTQEQLTARKLGKRIIGYSKDGKPIYSSLKPRSNFEMREEYQNREIKLRTSAQHDELENAMGSMSTYMDQNGIKDSYLSTLAARQGQNYLEYRTQKSAAARNNLSDNRFYFQSVRDASLRDANGQIINQAAYHQLIERGAGSDFHISSDLTGQALIDAQTTSDNAVTSVIADAYDMFEAERAATTKKYTTYLSKQVSKEVDSVYDRMLKLKNIDGIVAAQNITAQRGDYDKIEKKLSEYLDQDGYLQLDTDFANTLASNLLSFKNAAPTLGRLGKHINVETWRFTNGSRTSDYVTMKEYYTGFDSDGQKTKFNAQVLLQGTGLKDIDRTFYEGLSYDMDKYFTAANYGGDAAAALEARQLLFQNMTPQLIGAIGTFSSGSEQIVNTMGFITGAKYDSKSDSWSLKPETPEQAADYSFRTKKYLSFMTAQNIIDLKTDSFNAILARFANDHANITDPAARKQAAIADFYQFLQNNGRLAQIQEIARVNPSAISNMRPGVRKALGL